MKNQKGLTQILSLALIMAIVIFVIALGLYYINKTELNQETNKNINLITNIIKLENGNISVKCSIDKDCVIVNKEKDYSACCSKAFCNDFSEAKWVAVNNASFKDLVNEAKGDKCNIIDCPQYIPPSCPDKDVFYQAQCINNKCVKKIMTEY